MGSWFVCGFIPVLRPPLKQLPGGACMFASIAKHIDMQLRIVAGHALPPRILADDQLVDQQDLKARFESSQYKNTNLSTILNFVYSDGVTLKNGQRYAVQFDIQLAAFAKEADGLGRGEDHFRFVIDELGRWLGRGTLIGTMVICEDYPKRVESVYLGLLDPVYVLLKRRDGSQEQRLVTHTVVILGIFRVTVALSQCWNCPVGDYFEYQDSTGPEVRGLMGFGRTIGHPRVLLKVYQAPLTRFNLIDDL